MRTQKQPRKKKDITTNFLHYELCEWHYSKITSATEEMCHIEHAHKLLEA